MALPDDPRTAAPDGPRRPRRAAAPAPEATVAEVTAAELAVLGLGALLALVVAVALCAALARAFTPEVLAAGVATGCLALAGLAGMHRVPVRAAPREAAFALLLAALAGVLSVPGWDYVSGDRDPGVYVAHAFAIEREQAAIIPDPVAAAADVVPVVDSDPPPLDGPHGRFPGLWPAPDDPTSMKPQFYDAYASFLAVGVAAGGRSGLALAGPVCAMVAAAALGLATRRAFGATAGAVAGVLLATNALQVWQARYPTAELLAQALAVTALLAAVVAVEARWRPAAGLAGVLASTAFVVRPDGVALVVGAVAVAAGLFAAGRFGARAAWFVVGLAVPLPLALYQAYGMNEYYTTYNDAPSAAVLGAIVGALVGAGLVGRLVAGPLRRRLGATDARVERAQRIAGRAGVAAFAAFLAFAAARPVVLGEHERVTNAGERIRSWNEETMARLAWFFTWPGLALLVVGAAVVVAPRWRAKQFALVAPAVALVPLFVWNPHISSRLMWWVRRFVPLAVVGIVLLLALALAAGLRWSRGRPAVRRGVRAVSLAATAALVAFTLSTSLPLSRHDELAGSWELLDDLADLSGDQQGLYLWAHPTGAVYHPARMFGGPLWLVEGQLSAVLPADVDRHDLDAFRTHLGGRPTFVLTEGGPPPAAIVEAGAVLVLEGTWRFPLWEESDTHRPERARPLEVRLAVWELP